MPKIRFTKKLGELLVKSMKRDIIGRYFVMPGDRRTWRVVPKGRFRALRVFPTQAQAINFAKNAASKKNGEVFIIAETGQLENRISFVK